MLTVDQADRIAQLRPPYPPLSADPAEQCPGRTGWHTPQADDWNAGNRESACRECGARVTRRYADPTWRTPRPTASIIIEQEDCGSTEIVWSNLSDVIAAHAERAAEPGLWADL